MTNLYVQFARFEPDKLARATIFPKLVTIRACSLPLDSLGNGFISEKSEIEYPGSARQFIDEIVRQSLETSKKTPDAFDPFHGQECDKGSGYISNPRYAVWDITDGKQAEALREVYYASLKQYHRLE